MREVHPLNMQHVQPVVWMQSVKHVLACAGFRSMSQRAMSPRRRPASGSHRCLAFHAAPQTLRISSC